jgi:hypothetical protein
MVLQLYMQKYYTVGMAWGRMEFEGFEWEAGNIAKCQKYGVSCPRSGACFRHGR